MKSSLAIGLVFLFASCKPYYDAAKAYPFDELTIVEKSKTINLDFPSKIDFSGNLKSSSKNYNIYGSIKMESVEHYQLFIFSKTYGIEICRIELEKDQIIFIDKINKLFYRGKIENFQYLINTKITSENFLQLFFGRIFNNISLNKAMCLNEYTYSSFGFDGEIIFNSFGFLNKHKLVSQNIIFDLKFNDFSTKNDLPALVNGSLTFKKVLFNINLKYSQSKIEEILLKEIVVPSNYKEIL